MRNKDKARAHLQSAMKYLGFGMTEEQEKAFDKSSEESSFHGGTSAWSKKRNPNSNVSRNSIITDYDRAQQEQRDAKRKRDAEFAAFQESLKGYKPGGSFKSFPGAANKKGQGFAEV